jgi:hypothetical protein
MTAQFHPNKRTIIRGVFILCLLICSATGCNQANYTTVKHVKPVNRNRYYNPQKDKAKKRVKYTRKKILKRSPATPTVKKKKTPDAKPQRQDTVQYETDTTGFL